MRVQTLGALGALLLASCTPATPAPCPVPPPARVDTVTVTQVVHDSVPYAVHDTVPGRAEAPDTVIVRTPPDTVVRIETRVHVDTLHLPAPPPDTVLRVDTVVHVETRADTVVRRDTIVHVDTLTVQLPPPPARIDTLVRRDTVVRVDTLTRADTLVRVDTVTRRDTLVQRDTVIRRDTIVQRDTVLIPAPVDTAQPPLPPGEYSGILCDSIVVVHRTAAGEFYTLHTMGLPAGAPPDTNVIAPTIVNATLNRPRAWVAVVVPGPNPERMQIAYLPGDTEVLKNRCYDGPVTVFSWLATKPGQ